MNDTPVVTGENDITYWNFTPTSTGDLVTISSGYDMTSNNSKMTISYDYALNQELPEFSCIVPYKTMNELSKVMVSMKAETVQISMSDRQISFHIGDCKIISRLINGRFPDYKQVLPKNTLFEYKLSRQLLLNAADRANIIASHSNSVAKFKFSEIRDGGGKKERIW